MHSIHRFQDVSAIWGIWGWLLHDAQGVFGWALAIAGPVGCFVLSESCKLISCLAQHHLPNKDQESAILDEIRWTIECN